MDRDHIQDLWTQWRAADLLWQSSREAGAAPQEVEKLRVWADRYLIAFQKAFAARFKRYPFASEYQSGLVPNQESTG